MNKPLIYGLYITLFTLLLGTNNVQGMKRTRKLRSGKTVNYELPRYVKRQCTQRTGADLVLTAPLNFDFDYDDEPSDESHQHDEYPNLPTQDLTRLASKVIAFEESGMAKEEKENHQLLEHDDDMVGINFFDRDYTEFIQAISEYTPEEPRIALIIPVILLQQQANY